MIGVSFFSEPQGKTSCLLLSDQAEPNAKEVGRSHYESVRRSYNALDNKYATLCSPMSDARALHGIQHLKDPDLHGIGGASAAVRSPLSLSLARPDQFPTKF